MESDSSDSSVSLDIEGTSYHERNAYGSPIAPPSADHHHVIMSQSSEVQASEVEQAPLVQRTTCQCKNTCSRKRTAKFPGCPCRNSDEKCGTSCNCGTKKKACMNKTELRAVGGSEAPAATREPSAFERHRQAVLDAEKAIEEFVVPLSQEMKTRLLIRVLSQGRGSLDFAQNIVHELENPDEPPPEPRNNHLAWCICGVCEAMPNEEENKCCKKARCVTSYSAFHNSCIDRLALEIAIRARCDIRADLPDYSMNGYRKTAYRTYILWKYGKLGRGNRKVVPACVVRAIRRAYPSEDNVYMGFRQS
ncbi:uncharacterized protein LOC110239789 [Exaiptasia diaphana]|uniref:P2X purinoreceptor 7 intracellular domain-containing protein n=1 Tax=Exaiptasia diaphana TaxID=2652724 RepID=A0A913X9W7_EXADI|nr:uncharacterized protein LOC110239789 [Exaiptasia diaphana]KXJ13778.1 P2X purinoceptor 7 [Exaiptasia diaphana]